MVGAYFLHKDTVLSGLTAGFLTWVVKEVASVKLVPQGRVTGSQTSWVYLGFHHLLGMTMNLQGMTMNLLGITLKELQL